MRRKRLQHVADTLCHMLCGWRQTYSKPQLVRLGSGRLSLDILREGATFNGRPIPILPIAAELRDWMLGDIAANRIPLDGLHRVEVEADLTFSTITWERRTRPEQVFLTGGQEIRTGAFHRCETACRSLVMTGDARYAGEYRDLEEWPAGWPAV